MEHRLLTRLSCRLNGLLLRPCRPLRMRHVWLLLLLPLLILLLLRRVLLVRLSALLNLVKWRRTAWRRLEIFGSGVKRSLGKRRTTRWNCCRNAPLTRASPLSLCRTGSNAARLVFLYVRALWILLNIVRLRKLRARRRVESKPLLVICAAQYALKNDPFC